MDPNNAHTIITCTTTSGVGSNHVWRVTVGGQESVPSSSITSYLPPSVSSISGQGTFQAKTDGGQVVTIVGSELGSGVDTAGKLVRVGAPDSRCGRWVRISCQRLADDLVTCVLVSAQVVRYGPPPTASRFMARSCVVDADFVSITCLTAPGTGKGHSWVVIVDGNPSPVFAANTSYGAPVIATYSGVGTVGGSQSCFARGSDCGNTEGSQAVVITGQNFGSTDMGNDLVVRYGPTGSELGAENCSITTPHTVIQCNTVPGAGTRLKWSVFIGECMMS